MFLSKHADLIWSLGNADTLPHKLDVRERKQKERQTDKHTERQTAESETALLTERIE